MVKLGSWVNVDVPLAVSWLLHREHEADGRSRLQEGCSRIWRSGLLTRRSRMRMWRSRLNASRSCSREWSELSERGGFLTGSEQHMLLNVDALM